MDIAGTKILAFGTAGSQGTGLVDAVTRHGATPVRATTDPDRARRWAAGGEHAVTADLTDPASVEAAAAGTDAAVLHMPLGLDPDRGSAVVASITALRRAGLPVAVNLGSPVPPPGAPDPFRIRPLADAVLATGAVALTPTVYLENHAAPWAVPAIAQGRLVYPRPADDPLAWIATADVTAAAVAAVAAGVSGELLALAGPAPVTFEELAALIGEGIGRPLVFTRVTADEYARLLAPFTGEPAAAGVAAAYRSMPETPNPLMNIDASPAWRRLGLSPTDARAWAADALLPLVRSVQP